MAFFLSILLVLALGSGAWLAAGAGYGQILVNLTYLAAAIFVLGFVYKILQWARSPVPFCIPTTAGQQKTLDWIKCDPLENPPSKGWAVARMVLEVVAFRSLFRNKAVKIHPGPRVTYSSSKWLWLFAILFHYTFLVVFIRHFRFFFEPVPFVISATEFLDGIMQIGVPRLFMSGAILAVGVTLLLGRRLFLDKVRYISLLQDYFPLLLILGVAVTGIWMRYFGKTDIASIKVVTMGLVTFKPVSAEVLAGIGPIFYTHLFLVCCLLVYFPFSKLMHMGGVFMSPTRNLANDSRVRHYDNPWNPPKVFTTYAEYEDDFRDHMYEVGLPLEKTPEQAPAEDEAQAE